MRLSVCIPTYNRDSYTATQIERTDKLLKTLGFEDFEIVVSDNYSTDKTAHLCKRLAQKLPSLKYVRPKKHMPTAEENLCFALDECQGEYVWVLGDDDDPEPQGVLALIDAVKAGQDDIVIFNSHSHSYDGMRINHSRIPCYTAEWRGPLLDFVQRTGVWFVIAGFSTLLLRNPRQHTALFREYIDVSKIYSHVVWLLDAYSKASFRFCNTPLVSYRQNYTDVNPTNHWSNVALREKTFFKGLWTNKFLRLIDKAVERGALTPDVIPTIIDRNIENRFVLADEILRHFIDQLIIINAQPDPFFTSKEFEYYNTWAKIIFAKSATILHHLEAARADFARNGSVSVPTIDRLAGLLHDRASRPWYLQFMVGRMGPYDLFNCADQWWAVRHDAEQLGYYCAEHLDVMPAGDLVIVDSSYAALIKRIDNLIAQDIGANIPPDALRRFKAMSAASAAVVHELENTRRALADAQHRAAESQRLAEMIQASTFWRISGPVRRTLTALRIGRRRK